MFIISKANKKFRVSFVFLDLMRIWEKRRNFFGIRVKTLLAGNNYYTVIIHILILFLKFIYNIMINEYKIKD